MSLVNLDVYENGSPAFYNILAGNDIIGQYDGRTGSTILMTI